MATGTSSGRKGALMKSRSEKQINYGCFIDIMAGYDTRYPDHRPARNIRGNGPTPGNPFGKEIPKPKVG